jgi:hypothetical protein
MVLSFPLRVSQIGYAFNAKMRQFAFLFVGSRVDVHRKDWSNLPAGGTVFLAYRDDCILEITNAVLHPIPDLAPSNPIRVTAKVPMPVPKEPSAQDEDIYPMSEATIALCVLRPVTAEHQRISITFSPLNFIEIPPSTAEEDSSETEPEAVLEPDEIQARFRTLRASKARGHRRNRKRNRNRS